MKRTLLIAAVGLLLLAIAWRAAFFGISVRHIPAFDDECKIALQAKQIARGERPLTILASPYIFPLDAYLMAPFIHALPRNAFGARVMAFGFGLLTVALSLLVLRRWGSWKETWPGVALVLFPSAYLLVLQVGCALPGYPSLMLLGALVVWLAQRHAEASRRLWIPALLAGLAGGLAASDTLLSLPFLLRGGAMIAVARGWRSALVSAPVFGIGALIGFLPHLIATHLHSDAFQSVQRSLPLRSALKRILSPVLDRVLPAAFGWGPPIFPDSAERIAWPAGLDLYVGIALVLLLAVFTIVSLSDLVRRWRQERWPRVDTSLVFLGISWLCLALFILSARSHSHTYRYLIPIVWSFPFLVGYAYRRSGKACRVLLGAFTVLLLAANLAATAGLMKRWASPGFSDYLKSYDLKPVFQYLDQRGISRCYGTYVDAYRITFDADERIVCCQPYNERFPGWRVPFKEIVDAATNAAYVLSDTYRFLPGRFETDLAFMQVKYHSETCGGYEVYTDFESPVPPPGPEIPPSSLSFAASHNPEETASLHDGDFLTRWHSSRHQEKGMWIEVRLPPDSVAARLLLCYNLRRDDRPRAMRLLAWNGHDWTTVLDAIPRSLDEFEFLNGHPVYGNEIKTLRFPPVTTDRLRLEILEEEPKRDWTVGEIRVFGPEPPRGGR